MKDQKNVIIPDECEDQSCMKEPADGLIDDSELLGEPESKCPSPSTATQKRIDLFQALVDMARLIDEHPSLRVTFQVFLVKLLDTLF